MVLMTTSFLDEALKALLSKNLVGQFAPATTMALGTIARRRDACAALGLITPVMHSNIKIIGEIRNRFAHSHRTRSFSDPDVARDCLRLEFPYAKMAFRVGFEEPASGTEVEWPHADNPRVRFRLIVMQLATRIHLSVLGSREREPCRKGWEKRTDGA